MQAYRMCTHKSLRFLAVQLHSSLRFLAVQLYNETIQTKDKNVIEGAVAILAYTYIQTASASCSAAVHIQTKMSPVALAKNNRDFFFNQFLEICTLPLNFGFDPAAAVAPSLAPIAPHRQNWWR